jgi:hypothetical protein
MVGTMMTFVIDRAVENLYWRRCETATCDAAVWRAVRTFAWKHMAVPMWQGMMVCLGTLTFKRYYLQNL